MVTLVDSSVSDGAILDSSNRIIKWDINELNAGSSITLNYSVNVDNDLGNINKVVTENGFFYKLNKRDVTIGTGTIENKIVPKVKNLLSKGVTFESCYNDKKKDYDGLELIDKVYRCATSVTEEDFSFATDFKFGDKIKVDETIDSSEVGLFINEKSDDRTTSDVIKFSGSSKDADSKLSKFKNMILNNYWSGMSYVDDKVDQINWSGSDAGLRARTIRSEDFKEGDVLIYYVNYEWGSSEKNTTESGIYAFIYINGMFVGRNGTGTSDIYVDGEFVGRKQFSGEDRDVFSYKYYRIVDAAGDYNSDKYAANLYTAYGEDYMKALTSSERGKILTYANYQTLFDKDYYVVLRPEMVIQESVSMQIVSNPEKIEYVYGEDLNLTNGKFKVRYNDGSYSEEMSMSASGLTVSGFDKNKLGTQTVKITYDEVSAEFDVEVKMGNLFKDNISVGSTGDTNLIYDIEEGTKISDLKSKINVSNVTVTDSSGVDITSDDEIIKTGYKLKINMENGEEQVYLLSVKGDVNGDGVVNRTDLELSSEHIIGVTLINDLAQLYAANMDNNSTVDVTADAIDINDVIKLTRIVSAKS